jgi:septal ring factor EnvC (AmiA/AmiB activator)
MKLRTDRREQRRTEAQLRQAEYDKLSPAQRIAALDARLGKGKGARKERARLAKLVKAGRG